MALTIDDIIGQLGSLFNGGSYQGNGATTFAAPASSVPVATGTNSVNFSSGTLPNAPSNGFGMNLGTAGLALNGLQSLNSFLQGNKALQLAQDQFKFNKSVTNTNLNNSIQSYNTSLEDRLRARGAVEGTDSATVQDEIDRKKLTR